VNLVSLNLRDVSGIIKLIQHVRPDEVYNLAAQSSVGLSFEQPFETIESIVLGGINLLESIRLAGYPIRYYNAGSTECFGNTGLTAVDETAALSPCSPYAVAKAASYWAVANYRSAYGLYACTGILSNHDSPLRPKRFVTRKIIQAAAEIAMGKPVKLSLGNLEIERDWGWAPDYVEAIWRMMQMDSAEDYIVATGVTSTLRDFIDVAFRLAGKDWREFVSISPELIRPSDLPHSRVNPSKAASGLGWRATHLMPDVVRMMFEHELRTLTHKGSGL
jgi:GDPmannose 4,6-dehydratase